MIPPASMSAWVLVAVLIGASCGYLLSDFRWRVEAVLYVVTVSALGFFISVVSMAAHQGKGPGSQYDTTAYLFGALYVIPWLWLPIGVPWLSAGLVAQHVGRKRAGAQNIQSGREH